MSHPYQFVLFVGGPAWVSPINEARKLRDALVPIPQVEVEAAWISYGAGIARGPWAGLPFRAPHYTVSEGGMIGTLAKVWVVDAFKRERRKVERLRPGEVSLAHGGVLLLDELHEFRLGVIGALADVLHAGTVHGIPARPAIVVATAPAWSERLAKFVSLLTPKGV